MSATLARRFKWSPVLGTLAAAVSLVLAIGAPAAQAAAYPGFDDQASAFKIFWDCATGCSTGSGSVTDVPSPSEDGQALKINYASGNRAFEGLDAYDSSSFGTDSSALRYQVHYDFYFPNRTPIQALEFCMNNYFSGKRYQWAMQWEGKGTGAPQWRLWGGKDNGVKWKPIGISANNITAGVWHTLTIDGNIINGQVHYLDFIIDGTTHSLTGYTFSPDTSSGSSLVPAVQVDGDSNADPYQLYIDNAHFYWSNAESHPAVLGSPNSGNLAVFFNDNLALKMNFYFVSSNIWSGPMGLPGPAIDNQASPVAVGSPNGGNMAVFYRSNNTLLYDFYTVATNKWGGPYEISADIRGDPAVVGDPSGGNLAVFWRDSFNHLNEDFYFVKNNTWGGGFPIATAIDDAPVAIGSPDSGNLAVFYTNKGVLLEEYYLGSQNSWTGPFQLATNAMGTAAVLGSPDGGNIAVFYSAMVNGAGELDEVYYTVATNSWGGPYQLPGRPDGDPVAAIGNPNGGNMAVYFDQLEGPALVQDLYSVATNSWTGTVLGAGNAPAQPGVVGDADGGNRAVFYEGGAPGQEFLLMMNYFFGATGTWSGPTPIGGQIT